MHYLLVSTFHCLSVTVSSWLSTIYMFGHPPHDYAALHEGHEMDNSDDLREFHDSFKSPPEPHASGASQH